MAGPCYFRLAGQAAPGNENHAWFVYPLPASVPDVSAVCTELGDRRGSQGKICLRAAGKNRKRIDMKLLPLLLTMGLIFTRSSATAADLTMALGGFDVGKDTTAMAQVEYRFSTDWSGLRPQAGLFATADSGAYVYAGIGYPFAINEKWSLVPSLSGGYYNEGAGKNLGNDVEFYSQLRLEYRLSPGAGIGLGVGHISNAGIGDKNPGAEIVYLSYSISY